MLEDSFNFLLLYIIKMNEPLDPTPLIDLTEEWKKRFSVNINN